MVHAGLFNAFVITNTLEESEKVIARVEKETGVKVIHHFRDVLKAMWVFELPRVSRDAGKAFNKIKGTGDRAIAAAAVEYSAEVCTNDISDFKHASLYGFDFYTPQQLTESDTSNERRIFPGVVGTTSSQGTICAEIRVDWINHAFPNNSNDKYYIFDSEGIGSCFFDCGTHSFVAKMDGGPSICIPRNAEISRSHALYFVLSYDCNSEATLYIGTPSDSESWLLASGSMTGPWSPAMAISGSRTFIGCDRHGKSQLNGHLGLLYGVPYKASRKAVKNMVNANSVNDPWERLSLEDAIKLAVAG